MGIFRGGGKFGTKIRTIRGRKLGRNDCSRSGGRWDVECRWIEESLARGQTLADHRNAHVLPLLFGLKSLEVETNRKKQQSYCHTKI